MWALLFSQDFYLLTWKGGLIMNELTKFMKSDGLNRYYLIRQYGNNGHEIIRINIAKKKGYYTKYRGSLTNWTPTRIFDLTNDDLLMIKEIISDFIHNPNLTTGWNPKRISTFW